MDKPVLLKDKKVLVTGGSRGIGFAVVEECLKSGADVLYLSRTESAAHEQLKETAEQNGRQVYWVPADISDEESAEEGVKKAYEVLGAVDVLVNNAGITRDSLVFRMKREAWEEVLRVNLTSAFYTCRTVARHMAKNRSGSIINISSVVGISGNGGQTSYSASKAGLIGFSKSLAKEIASRGVRVNVIAPGYIETEMTAVLKDEITQAIKQQIPLGVLGSPKHVADSVIFLASDMSSYITGHVLVVDGGMIM